MAACLVGCATGQDSPFSGVTFGTGSADSETGAGIAPGDESDSSGRDDGATRGASADGDASADADATEGPTDATNDAGESTGGCVPEEEVCDGLDNDCDDEVDEGFNVDSTCSTGLPGICADGVNVCRPDGSVECVPDNEATDEACNGLDDDCDGAVDNGDPGGGDLCDTGMLGVCSTGVNACTGGSVVCVPDEVSSGEQCNGLDDDCDGATDEGISGVGGSCSTGMSGVCAAGTLVCDTTGMSLVCQANQAAMGETCNNLDDDCNGVIDDGVPGTGGSCSTGLQGVCSAGTNVCNSAVGMIQCQQNVSSSSESCGNGLDDDCNGTVDNGCPCPHGLCSTGTAMISGCNSCVTTVCASDSYCCTNSWDGLCVDEVATFCNQADCVDDGCSHLVCVTGTALSSSCHSCVSSICASDGYCCSNTWDTICVGEVSSICGLSCP